MIHNSKKYDNLFANKVVNQDKHFFISIESTLSCHTILEFNIDSGRNRMRRGRKKNHCLYHFFLLESAPHSGKHI